MTPTPTIRVFRAPDARAALEAIKSSLGPDAVILGTREVKGGFFRKTEIEVTAGLPIPPSPLVGERAGVRGQLSAAKYAEQSNPAPSRHETPPGLQPAKSLRDELSKLRGELDALKRSAAPQPLPTQAAALERHLLDRGMETTLASDAIAQAVERAESPNHAHLLAAVRDVLAERVVAGRAPWLPDRRRVIALVGPTGVGKTTTLAKIAAQALQHKQSVALVTVDTFRIGAAEQLQRYASIMNLPSAVARDRAELELSLRGFARADLVLIDTAGRADAGGIRQQAELVRGIAGTSLHLVASAATGAKELAAVVERYRGLGPERLVLTKLDEVASPAAFFSAAFRLSRPIVALANGQRVPEDIRAPFTPELVELLLGPTPFST